MRRVVTAVISKPTPSKGRSLFVRDPCRLCKSYVKIVGSFLSIGARDKHNKINCIRATTITRPVQYIINLVVSV